MNFYAQYPFEGGSGSGVVTSLNTLTGDVVVEAGTGISVTVSGQDITIASTATPLSIGALDSQSANANGLSLVSSVLSTQSASQTEPGLVNTASQGFSGLKTFTGGIATGAIDGLSANPVIDITNFILKDNNGNHSVAWNVDQLTDTNNDLSLDWLNRLLKNPGGSSLLNWNNTDLQIPYMSSAGAVVNDASGNLTSAARGTVTEATSSVLTLSNWSNATIGSPTIQVKQASTSQSGYLSSTDWNTFNGKAATGNYATSGSGDVSWSAPSGAGPVTTTLATVNSNTGSFGSSTSIPSFTVNGKGLITAASGNAVVAPAGTLSGTVLNSTVVSSSLTSVGTIATGTWNGTAVGTQYGGLGQNWSSSSGVPVLVSGAASLVAAGTNGNVLTDNGTTWVSSSNPSTGGTNGIYNVGLSNSVSSNAMTINLLTNSGSNPSSGSPCQFVYRSTTATTGTTSLVNSTAATSIVIPSGATLGQTSAVNQYVWVYALNNAGTVELAVSGVKVFPDNSIQSTTAISSSSTSGTTLYSTTARTSVAVRLIGQLLVNESTAGTWASAATTVSIAPAPQVNVSDWNSSYTFTVNNFGTVSAQQQFTKRVGDMLEVVINWTSGTTAGSTASISLPSGLAIDSTKLPSTTQGTFLGFYAVSTSSSQVITSNGAMGAIFYDGSTTSAVYMAEKTDGSSYVFNKDNGSSISNNNQPVAVRFSVPIAGWSQYGP